MYARAYGPDSDTNKIFNAAFEKAISALQKKQVLSIDALEHSSRSVAKSLGLHTFHNIIN